jgi:hypothetical protein
MATAMRLASWLMTAALCGTVSAQIIYPSEPRYLEPVYLGLGPNPYERWQAAQVSMEGSTIVARIQSIHCTDLCGPGPVPDVALGRFPTGTYTVLMIFNDNDVTSKQFTVTGPKNPLILVDYSGMWWLPSESGWGISIWQGPTDLIFAVWFVYDSAGRPTWYTLHAESIASSASSFGGPSFFGPIFKTNGPYFGGQFDPSQVGIAMAGSGSLSFVRSDVGYFHYVVDGVAGTKEITRQIIE